MTLDQTFVQQALQYARRGWAVFPLVPKTKRPLTGHGLNDATTDPATIRAWWQEWPDANIGINCGASGLVVVDVDAKNGAPGLATWQRLLPQIGGQIDTPTVQTPTGGYHYYYLAPQGVDLAQGNGKLGPGVDVKGQGGYVVAPPSIHPDTGTAYTWFDGYDLERDILPLPTYFVRMLERKQAPSASRSGERDVFALGRDILEAGKALQRLAPWRCEEYGAWVDVGMALSELGAAGLELWDKWSQQSAKYDSEICTQKWQTFEPGNGLTLASLFHWAKEDTLERQATKQQPQETTEPKTDPTAEPKPPLVAPRDTLTDVDNGARLVALFGDRLRWTPQYGWMVWDGKRWQIDTSDRVNEYAKRTARSYYKDAAEAAATGNDGLAAAFAKHAKASLTARAIRAMVDMAHSDRRIVADIRDFDQNPWLLNCQNGTIDLRTGQLKPHDKNDLITKLAPVEYDPTAEAPLWEAFQEKFAGGDPDLMAFKRRMYGYALTGKVSEQCFFLLHGKGANGKSTEIETVRGILGEDYSYHLPKGVILASPQGERHGASPELADLRGMRFVDVQETNLGQRLNESLIKELTGGDRRNARAMYKNPFLYDPTDKLFIATNNKPVIRENTHAIWRRVKLVPYKVTIPENEKILDYHEVLLEREAAGILAWLVRGCLEWQAHGLGTCEAVAEATKEYQSEQDILGAFLEDRCFLSPTAEVSKGDLYEAYSAWCAANKEQPLGTKSFSQRLSEGTHGISEYRTSGVRMWRGIGLLAQDVPQDVAEGSGEGPHAQETTREGDWVKI